MDKFSYFTRPDLTYNNHYTPSSVEIIYNTILLPIDKYPELYQNELPNKVILYNQNHKSSFEQSVVFDNGIIELNNNKYRYFYIAPGIRIANKNLQKNDFALKINNSLIKLNLIFNKNIEAKFIIGMLVLSNNYYYYFNNLDNINLYINNTTIQSSIYNKHNKYNYYMPNTINTILDIMNPENLYALYALNSNEFINNIKAQSLSVTKSFNKGSIILNKLSNSNIVYNIKCIGLDNNFVNDYYMNSNRLNIKNLSKGLYKLEISNKLDNYLEYIINVDGSTNIHTNTKTSLNQYKNTVINKL